MGVLTQPIQFLLTKDKDDDWREWNMDWLEQKGLEQITTKYKRILEENTNIPVIFFDERLTSVISNSILIEADISRKKRKKKVDSIAAQIILQDYLNKEKNEHE